MPVRLLLIFLLSFAGIKNGTAAPYTYEYDDNCSKAYQYFLSLHLQEGRVLLAAEAKANPTNLMATYLADYEDCIVLLLNCDKTEYARRADHLDERIALLDKGEPSSPWYRFCKAGVYLHRAIAEIRFGDQYKAALNFRRSFSLLKENERLFPTFEYNSIFTGLEEAVIGSLPGSYKWLAGAFGMKGDVKKGTAKLANFVSTHTAQQPFRAETVLYYLYARFYMLSEQQQAWDYLNSAQFPTTGNLLNTFAKVNIALDYRKSAVALQVLKQWEGDATINAYPIFDYQHGMALLSKADTLCTYYFARYLRNNKSDIYIKDVWQKMAFAWYVNGNMLKANYCLQQVKTQGNTRLDADKQAKRFAESNTWPLRPLLQARLLIDGGYYEQALAILNKIDEATLANPADKAEYHFRLGRIYEETATGAGAAQNTKLALANYRAAILAGKDRHEQFAARAALQIGSIYEQRGMKNEAVSMYNQCLDMPAHDFQNSIDQQAKAGINRIATP